MNSPLLKELNFQWRKIKMRSVLDSDYGGKNKPGRELGGAEGKEFQTICK